MRGSRCSSHRRADPSCGKILGESFNGVRDAVGRRYRDFAARAKAEFDAAESQMNDAADQARAVANDLSGRAADAASRVTS
ncbi:MAG: hypothetical protein QM736_00010 [Vicinamibacterales bacterium]